MARIELGSQTRGKLCGCSYKKTTLIVCSINIVLGLYAIRCLYISVYMYSNSTSYSQESVKYTPDQLRKMVESIQIRKAAEPIELVNVVENLTRILDKQKRTVKLPLHLKQMIRNEILQQLKSLPPNANATEQRGAIENWREAKLHEAKLLILGQKNVTLNISPNDAALLVEAMERSPLLEDLGLWIPPVIVNKEHDDKPPGMDEYEEDPLPGRPVPQECHAELHTDYGGAAVRWGLTHHKESAADCCQACLDQARRAMPGDKKCNIWVYCPSESGCFSPDIYEHKHMECWLKYSEKPKFNFKDKYSDSYRSSHPNAPLIVPWVSGVVSA